MRLEVGRDSLHSQEWLCHRIRGTPTLFLEVCETKGF